MDQEFKEKFINLWQRYFPGAELPITFYYTERELSAEMVPPAHKQSCLICELAQVRRGKSLLFDCESLGCGGAQRYLGFVQELRPNFEYFLSCGIKGELEGERYKKTPGLVLEVMKRMPVVSAPHPYIVFKRWDRLEDLDSPEAVIFFATPDVLSGLFTLVNFDREDPDGVFAPFAAGCGSIVHYPYLESQADDPRAVLGMFDVSARPCVGAGVLSFAVPMVKFSSMVENMEQSFLITGSWNKVQKRIGLAGSQPAGPE
ncbi:MAG: hypothetical protein A2Z86_03760 [Candidatus Glassbacteria bacterium GWA2_58_10]|uniref:DUF169 domain-containing protein n=1 Tax=Candidatus Glassbacteria bacterium GWA2_58_10 TaxID=1817865 RepID=A0A1F5YET0_9BACT|nr:MAG: hypothetical protein A2Z86_03760 [Candidatus Glassbacteria bacterium GWA2_58_10]